SSAVGADSRIGRRFLTGALGYGGPCFPRDNKALASLARSLGVTPDIPVATDSVNRRIVPRLMARLDPWVRQQRVFAVLGLTYKPDSHVTEESQGLALADALAATGASVITFDRLLAEPERGRSLIECLEQADVIVITSPDPL